MSEPPGPQDELLVAIEGECALVRVQGRGYFKNAASLKRFGVAAIGSGCRRVVLDMDECRSMDSTFMGVLAGLALRLRKETDGRLVAMNLSPKTASLLDTLGLTRLIETHEVDADPDGLKKCVRDMLDLSALDATHPNQRLTLETMLEAHQTLAETTTENRARFKDVIAYLEQDLEQLKG